MVDPAWGIWGKCPPCGGASHASDIVTKLCVRPRSVYILVAIYYKFT